MELDHGPITEPNVADCQKGSIFHRKSQYGRETGRFCCVEEGQTTLQTRKFFDYRSFRATPACQTSLIFRFASDREQRLSV